MKISYLIIVASTACLLISCGVAKRTVRQSPPPPHPSESSPSSLPSASSVSKYAEVKVSLRQAYRDWKGTPYVWGGESHRGIDCSGLMQFIFKSYFGVDLPRTTKRQLYTGVTVPREDLKSGDLVFFNTGHKELHVGVIVGRKKFLHASVSQGVMISSLKEQYWKSHYMSARRVMQF
jgi:cell wall-associated NlpC family hydrolase